MFLPLLFLACTSGSKESEEDLPAATIQFLVPLEGEEVLAGEASFAVVVENFSLVDPAKHNEGTATGYIQIRLDGTDVLQSGSTNFTVTVGSAGAHAVEAELYYEDGDTLEPAVKAEVNFTAVIAD
jgi:hypothetical protein